MKVVKSSVKKLKASSAANATKAKKNESDISSLTDRILALEDSARTGKPLKEVVKDDDF